MCVCVFCLSVLLFFLDVRNKKGKRRKSGAPFPEETIRRGGGVELKTSLSSNLSAQERRLTCKSKQKKEKRKKEREENTKPPHPPTDAQSHPGGVLYRRRQMGMEGSDRRVGGREEKTRGRKSESDSGGGGGSDSEGDKRGIISCKSGNPEWPHPRQLLH